jgi:uncharacterized protein (DUF952 family)
VSPDRFEDRIFHLTPASYYHCQPLDQPYQPATFAEEGFIHCTAGAAKLIEIANLYFTPLQDELLALEIDPARLAAPLIFEPPIPPQNATMSVALNPLPNPNTLFPHIYGPLNRQAIIACFTLKRDALGQWQMPG